MGSVIFAIVAIPFLLGYFRSFRERKYLYSYEQLTAAYEADCARMERMEQ